MMSEPDNKKSSALQITCNRRKVDAVVLQRAQAVYCKIEFMMLKLSVRYWTSDLPF